MKLRVVGWVSYYDDYPEKKAGWAARNAIIDDIKKNGYLFSGKSHQEDDNCIPVLNDGYAYSFSQRGWGGIMAEAHGHFEQKAYARYAFDIDREHGVIPTLDFDEENFVAEEDLNEKFTLSVDKSVFDAAKNEGKINLDDLPELRYIDIDDILELLSEGESAVYAVDDVDRNKDLTQKQRFELDLDVIDFMDPVKRKRADEEFAKAKIILSLKLSPLDSEILSANPEDFLITDGELIAYNGCGGDVVIPHGVKSIIGPSFDDCDGIRKLVIPCSVTEIDESAFDKCSSLQTIVYKGTVERWKSIIKGKSKNSEQINYTVICSDGFFNKKDK